MTMRFFRVHFCMVEAESHGFAWFHTKEEADKASDVWIKENWHAAPETYCDVVDIDPTPDGILKALNRYAAAPNDDEPLD